MRECASKGDVGLGRCSLVRADFRALFPSALHIDLIEKLTYPTHHLLIVGVLSEECGSLYGREKGYPREWIWRGLLSTVVAAERVAKRD